MPNQKENSIASKYRQRVQYEDQLLYSRTGVVLTLNGLAAVAVGLSLASSLKVVIASAIILIDLLWVINGRDAYYLISRLLEEMFNSSNVPVDEDFRRRIQKGRFRAGGPTWFVALFVPTIVLLAWIGGLVVSILTAFFVAKP